MKVSHRIFIFILLSGWSLFSETAYAQQVTGTITIEPVHASYTVQDTVWVTYSWPLEAAVGSASWNQDGKAKLKFYKEDSLITGLQNPERKQLRTGLIFLEEGKINLSDLIRTDSKNRMVWQGVEQLDIHAKKLSHQYDNLFQNTSTSHSSKKASIGSKDIFIAIELSKPTVFIGEEVVVSYYVLSTAQFTPNDLFIDEIRFAYKWEDENQGEEKLRESVVKVGGRNYYKNLVKRMHIFPQAAGSLEVGKGYMEGVANIPVQDNSLDAQLARISGQELIDTQQVQITCPSKMLEVVGSDQLKNGQDFLTGSYVLSVTSSDSVLNVQTPMRCIIRVEGFGNLKYIHPVLFSDSVNWEIEAPIEIDSFYVKEGRIYGFREYQYTLTPLKSGSISLPPVRLACLSTTSRQLEWLQSESKQIRVIDPDAKKKFLAKKEEEEQKRFWKRLLIAMATLLVGSILILRARKYYVNKYLAPIARRKESIRLAKLPMNQLLNEMDRLASTDLAEKSVVEDQVYKSIVHYLKDRFRLNEHHLNEKSIAEAMEKRGCSAESIREFSLLYNGLLERNFGIRRKEQDMDSLVDGIKNTVLKLEEPLKD
jgi:hypothetical protein